MSKLLHKLILNLEHLNISKLKDQICDLSMTVIPAEYKPFTGYQRNNPQICIRWILMLILRSTTQKSEFCSVGKSEPEVNNCKGQMPWKIP